MRVTRPLDVRVLGPLEVYLDGYPLGIPGAKPRAVLTMLGLHAGRVVPAEVLQSVLWGAAPPPTAAKALQTHVATLRRVIGRDAIVTHGGGWRLATDRTDATDFDAALRAGRDAARDGAPAIAVAHFDRALAAWRGSPQLPPTLPAQAEQTRWNERYESVLDDRTDALLACGQAAELVSDLEAAVAHSPLRERRWAQLAIALYRAGRQGDALNAYQRARTVLAEELGVEPGPELRRCCDPPRGCGQRARADGRRAVSRQERRGAGESAAHRSLTACSRGARTGRRRGTLRSGHLSGTSGPSPTYPGRSPPNPRGAACRPQRSSSRWRSRSSPRPCSSAPSSA